MVYRINGDARDNVIRDITAARDSIIQAGYGNDTVYAYKGEDTVYGGYGSDSIYGGDGNDKLYSHTINSANGVDYFDDYSSDQLYGGRGSDYIQLSGGPGFGAIQLAYGEDGNDWMYITGHTAGRMYGGAGNDTLVSYTSTGAELYGGNGNDVIQSIGQNSWERPAGRDAIWGGNGNDDIRVNADDVDAGAGNDYVTWDGRFDDETLIRVGPGTDKVTLNAHWSNGEAAGGPLTRVIVYDVNPYEGDKVSVNTESSGSWSHLDAWRLDANHDGQVNVTDNSGFGPWHLTNASDYGPNALGLEIGQTLIVFVNASSIPTDVFA